MCPQFKDHACPFGPNLCEIPTSAMQISLFTWASTQAQFFQYFYTNPAIPSFLPPLPTPLFSNFFPEYRQQKSLEVTTPAPPKQDDSVEIFAGQPQPNFSPASDNYRGFGYHTKYDDGASATVVFFRGGPNGNSILEGPNEPLTIASDGLDPQQPFDIQQRIRNIFEERTQVESRSSKQLPFPNLARIVEAFQDDETPQGVVHFYATPAGTVSLPRARALNITSPTNETSTNSTNSEGDAAESIQTRTVLKLNTLENEGTATTPEPTTSTTTTSAPAVATTSATAAPATSATTPISAVLETTTVDNTIAVFLNSTESNGDNTTEGGEEAAGTTESVDTTTTL